MARFQMELPNDLLKDFERLNKDTDKILGAMTRSGADVVMENIKKNVPESFKSSKIMNCLQITRTYKTPSDDGINTKVGFYGYFENSKGQIVPAPLVANVMEYGSTKQNKHPFLRKSFRKEQIEKAMMETQIKESGGLLT